jgi:predicted NodU family carbamoyl transferase
VTVSHHLAHAYSAFAACPFNEGVVMVVDGVGNYNSDITEPGQLTDNVNPLARESESYYKFDGEPVLRVPRRPELASLTQFSNFFSSKRRFDA